jgi:GNAT superfamily N-acetyltransferase
VGRSAVTVRAAGQDDADGLVELWGQLRTHLGRTAQYTPTPSVERVLETLDFADHDAGARMLVAVADDQAVGMALAVLSPISPYISFQAVHVDYLHVREGYERRGVGKALLTAATAYADEVGSDHLLVNVFPANRDAHRFYARLGFQPVVTRRMAHVSVLRRRLGLETASSAHEGRSARRRAVLSGRRPLVSGLRRS